MIFILLMEHFGRKTSTISVYYKYVYVYSENSIFKMSPLYSNADPDTMNIPLNDSKRTEKVPRNKTANHKSLFCG